MPYADPEKKAANYRRWVERNREKQRAYQRAYQRRVRENPEQVLKERIARKAYYEKNKENEQAKAREYMRVYYAKNRKELNEKRKLKYQAALARLNEYMKTQKCLHCGLTDIECLEFHHPIPKGRKNGKRVDPVIKTIVMHKWKKLMAEISRCWILCANCHRKEHARLRREQAD